MKRLLPLVLAAAGLSGCAAHMIETHGDQVTLKDLVRSSSEPKTKGGVIRYLHKGIPAMRQGREKDAKRQMTKFCGGDYTVTAEGPRSKFGADMPIPGKGASLELDEYWYQRFECAAK